MPDSWPALLLTWEIGPFITFVTLHPRVLLDMIALSVASALGQVPPPLHTPNSIPVFHLQNGERLRSLDVFDRDDDAEALHDARLRAAVSERDLQPADPRDGNCLHSTAARCNRSLILPLSLI